MKRAIKFRGKRLGSNEWVYGSLLWNESTPAIMEYDGESVLSSRVYEVDPDTIGQFTTLYYSDGKEMYEGDIVQITYDEYFTYEDGFAKAVVTWHDSSAALMLKVQNSHLLLSLSESKKAVIYRGNIHNNPELLED